MIKNLSKMILYVENMQKQVEFYRDLLKIPLLEPVASGDYQDEAWVIFDTGACQLALHRGGKKRLGQEAPRFCFEADNLKASREVLSLKGVKVGPMRSPAPGIWVLDAEDPEGNQFSLESRE